MTRAEALAARARRRGRRSCLRAARAGRRSRADPRRRRPKSLDDARPSCAERTARAGRCAIADRQPEVREEREKFPGSTREAFLKGPAAGRSATTPRRSRRAAQGDRPGPHRRPQRRASLEAWTGYKVAVDDGARLPRRVRAQGQRAVRVDPAARAVRRCRSCEPRRPFADAAPRPARAERRSRCRSRSSTTREIEMSVPLVVPAARLPAGAHAVDRPAARERRGARRPLQLLVPVSLAGGRRSSSCSASASG